MADTTSTTTPASATVERIDPQTLLVDTNVRLDPALATSRGAARTRAHRQP